MTKFDLIFGLLALQRLAELNLAHRHNVALRTRGAVEHGADHYKFMVLLHLFWFLSSALEARGNPLSGAWPFWATLALLGQSLRWHAILTLKERWTTRVLTLPGKPPIRRGLYAYVPHPNYLGVVLELLAFPMLFGAWKTALICGLLHLALLRIRIRVEDLALRQ